MIELNEAQRQAVMNGEAVRVSAPEIGRNIVLLLEEEYCRLQAVREEEEDRKEQAAFLRLSYLRRGPHEGESLLIMIQQGEIYDYSDPTIPPHPVLVVSREELNRGDRVVAAIITSKKFAVRSALANCVVLRTGMFGMTKDCVVQGESVFNAPTLNLDLAAGPVGKLDDLTMRAVIKAIGHVLDSDCEPN